MSKETKVEELTFEQALIELEQLVEKMEQPDIKLEDSIQSYEQALLLSKHCKQLLDKMEARIEKVEEGETIPLEEI